MVIVVALSIYSVFLIKTKSVIHKWTYSILFTVVIGAVNAFLPNYYHYRSYVHNENTGLELPAINVYDSDGKKIDFRNMQGSMYVIDIWNSSCGVCIKEFPKFEQLKDEYKNDSSVKFYTLNLPLKRDVRHEIDRYTNPYTFDKLYADSNVSKQLNINLIPQYMIIDKNSRIQYIGSLHTGKLDFYKNFYTILNNAKNEK